MLRIAICDDNISDLSVIFSNAIENAINACLKLKDAKDRLLQIVCKIKMTNCLSKLPTVTQEHSISSIKFLLIRKKITESVQKI